MELSNDWRKTLRYAWSIRLNLLAALLGGLEVLLPMFSDLVPRYAFAVLSIGLTLGAAWARLVAQPKTMPKG